MRRALLFLPVCLLAWFVTAEAQQDAKPPSTDKIKAAIEQGVALLLKLHKDNTHWELDGLPMQFGSYIGGETALVCLALLEAGQKPDLPKLKEALDYLRTARITKTYCRALRMQVLAFLLLHHPKHSGDGDRELLKKDQQTFLSEVMLTSEKEYAGWAYPGAGVAKPDFSNTHAAIIGLFAAHQAGVKTDKTVWTNIKKMTLRLQRESGAWSYHPDMPDRLTMTLAGMTCLYASAVCLEEQPPVAPLKKAWQATILQTIPTLHRRKALFEGQFDYYALTLLDEACVHGKIMELKWADGINVRPLEVVTSALLNQLPRGWRNPPMVDGSQHVATSFAIIYLSRRLK